VKVIPWPSAHRGNSQGVSLWTFLSIPKPSSKTTKAENNNFIQSRFRTQNRSATSTCLDKASKKEFHPQAGCDVLKATPGPSVQQQQSGGFPLGRSRTSQRPSSKSTKAEIIISSKAGSNPDLLSSSACLDSSKKD